MGSIDDIELNMVEINLGGTQTHEQQPHPQETRGDNNTDNTDNVFVYPRYCKYLHYPTFTIIVSIVDVALFIWPLAVGGFVAPSINPMLGPSTQTLLNCGAKYTPYILQGQWWRLISSMFLHAGFIHIILNLTVQLILGWSLERKYGTPIFATIYLLSGLGGMLLSAILGPDLITVGASGALFGIIAIWTFDVFQNLHNIKSRGMRIFYVVLVVSNIVVSLALGLLPLVDNFAHIGGLLFGTELCFIFVLKFKCKRVCWSRIRIVIMINFILVFLANFIGFFVILFMTDVYTICSWCHYLSCIPMIQNGVDWCSQ